MIYETKNCSWRIYQRIYWCRVKLVAWIVIKNSWKVGGNVNRFPHGIKKKKIKNAWAARGSHPNFHVNIFLTRPTRTASSTRPAAWLHTFHLCNRSVCHNHPMHWSMKPAKALREETGSLATRHSASIKTSLKFQQEHPARWGWYFKRLYVSERPR